MQKRFLLGVLLTYVFNIHTSSPEISGKLRVISPDDLSFNESFRLSPDTANTTHNNVDAGCVAPTPTPTRSRSVSPSPINAIIPLEITVTSAIRSHQVSPVNQTKAQKLSDLLNYFADDEKSLLSSNTSLKQTTKHLANVDEFRTLTRNTTLTFQEMQAITTRLLELEAYFANTEESFLESNASFNTVARHIAKVEEYRKLNSLLFQ